MERIEKKLYSRNTPNIIDEGRTELKDENQNTVQENWQESGGNGFDEMAARVSRFAGKENKFIKKLFVFSAVFFVLAAGVAAFVFLGGMNIVSSKNVDIKVVGPLSVPGGEEISLDINVVNNNNTDLESAYLIIEYPEGARSAADLTQELDRERFPLDRVKSGESYSQNIKIVFFGEKESVKEIKISLEYRVENSSALFYKEKIHQITLSSSPVIITPTYPKEINSNQDISFNIEVASNSKDPVEDFLVKVEYPFGFVFKKATPAAMYGENTWRFNRLAAGEKKTVTIEGNIIGQDNEEKVFKISAGTASEDDEGVIVIPFLDMMESLTVKRSFIGLEVLIGGKEGDYAGRGGIPVTVEVAARNNLPTRLFNTSVEVVLSGGALNPLSVLPNNSGFFQSSNNTIFWDSRSLSGLSDMEPAGKERMSFKISPLQYENIARGTKPEINMTIKAKGERVLESGSVEQVSVIETRKIILSTDITLETKVTRSVGNIENYGPIPPKAEIPTSYTVTWSITNSSNQVSNVEVRATLPSYARWTNLHSPTSEMFSLNKATNELVWNVGSVLPDTGSSSSKKEIYFQIEILPSLSQLGRMVIILGQPALTGIDKLTGMKIETKASAATTNFSGDPTFKSGDDKVVE